MINKRESFPQATRFKAVKGKASPWVFAGLGLDQNNPLENRIVQFVCNKFGLSLTSIVRKDKSARLVFPRHLIMFMMHLQGYSPSRIGKILRRDRTSVYHGIEAIENYLTTGHDRAEDINEVMLHFSEN